ncbi:putative repeat protein (TIGR01451 family) [Runella defluvii]|uniref:Putative repeat protein (TIGR01451 family) n=1 Tax=Runella defluvii TaxID=370973 RepID=A0A7W5ZUU8_9BACT|nr:SdrD B-like domain-containing protein [Runella defluvii]MBB3842179.1 putative repeat protein (TIGR01451 family) [Runella defluvii]
MKKLLRSNRNNLLHDASLHRGDTFTEKLRIAFLAVALCLISIAWSEAQTISNCPTLAATEIAGSVWKDYNYNGAKDETLVGVQGVTVKAYDCNGILVGTVTTDGSGNYKFTGMVAGQKYRIEFTLPAIVSSSYNLTKAGAGGRTTVQFVQAGQCASLGIARPEDYCEVNPLLATTCFANGDPLVSGTAGPDGAVVTFDNNSIGNGTATGTDPATKVATASQVGSSFGIAWDRKNKKMLVSAFAKRHVGFGPLGEGGIYQVEYSSGAPVVSNWLDVKTLGIPVDNVGTGTTIADRNISRGLMGDKLTKSLDAAGYSAVGKTSIGNIEFNKNADTLFFVNLTNRTVYAINVATKTLAGTYPPPTVAGCAGTFRIFALKYHEGKLFMGGVCDGTTPSNMNSKVYRLDGTTWTEIFSMTMDYPKGYAFWGSCINNTGWYPWTDTPPAACDIQGAERGFVYPTPIFSDIEFDVDGSMILAFMDRTAHQIGWRNASPTNINDTWSSFVGGDILRIYNNNGTYVLENNGTAGPNTSGGANKGQGPGGGEFYFHDFLFEPHAETSMGGLAFRKGSGEIALTAMDPFETRYDSGGINWFSNSTGASSRNQGYYVYAGPESFGKSAGLGDVEYLCGLAPIEIGNRVWIDLDKDGIQDPCEGSLPNMNVSLYKGNVLIAATKTNAQGEYYFSSKSALAVGTWSGTGADTALLTNTAYKLVFAEGQSTAGLVTLSGLGQFSISPKDVTTNNGNDQNDSDVALQGGSIGINLTTGSEGASNHSFDAGFIPLSSPITCGMLIDSLTAVQNSLTNGRVSSVQSSSILLGGERDMNFVSNIPTSSTTTLFEVGPYFAGGNVIEITNQAASSSILTVQWDGLDGDAVNLNPTGLGGLNFAALGINRLKAQLNADFPPNTNDSLQIRLELYTNAGAASRITKNFKFTSSTFNAIEFKFSDFVPFVGSGVDLSNIGAVAMFIDMSPNTVSTRTGWDVLLKDLTLECCTKPVASATPRTQTICVGGTASAFTATPSTGVEYKWYGPLTSTSGSLGTAISGATGASYTPTGAALTTAGTKYYAVVVKILGEPLCSDTVFVMLKAEELIIPSVTAQCHANGTPENGSDDYMVFTLKAIDNPSDIHTFTVTATQAGSPLAITLSNGNPATGVNCGLDTPLRTASGSAGKGNITLTVTDNVTGCSKTITITDPGTCAVACVEATPTTVSYEYRSQTEVTELSNLPLIIPRFDEQGGTRVLTSVKLDYIMGAKTASIYENTAVTSKEFTSTTSVRARLNLNGSQIVNSTIQKDVPTTTLPVGVLVPAQGTWPGDSTLSQAGKSTLVKMGSWVSDYLSFFKDPRTDSRWVTNATGDATDDDDMYYSGVLSDSTLGSFTYNTATSMAPFIGSGNVPLAANTLTGVTVLGGGGNIQSIQRTRAYAGVKVTYTFECVTLCTKPVASATPRTQTICVGGIASAFTATLTTGVEYKWYGPMADTTSSLGTAVSGATSATFTPSGAALTTAGTKYYAVVVNTTGDVTCADTAYVRLVVNAKPVIADGSATICAGESVDLTTKVTNYNSYQGQVWTVGTAGGTVVATPSSVKPTGTTIYVLVAQNAAGCKDTANVVVTVNAKPNAGKDTTLACVNAANNTLATSYTLVPSPSGGTWTQLGTTPTTATITGNNVTGMSVAGTYQFIYTTTAGCKDTVAVTVAPCAGCVKPNAGADAANVCQPTSTAKLTAVTAGGTWAPIGSPANPSAATIDASGNISGLNAAGTYKFVYSITSGGQTCTDTAQLIVLAKPVIADGSATICAGESVDLTSKITNYNTYLSPVWTIGTAGGTAVTTPSSVKPTGTTTYVLVAQNAAGCKDTANVVVTVNPKPSAGKDTTLACVNAATNTLATSYTLVPSPTGGSWSQLGTTPTTATISGNNVTGMTIAGTYQFIYTTTAGCKDTVAVTVAPCAGCVKPNAGADAASVCQPTSTAKLTAVTAGGTWAPIGSPANPSAATIDASGNISGLNAAGTYKFVYSITSGGQTCTDTAQVIVLAKPVIADGSATICAGESVDLTTKITNYNTYLSPVWTVGTANGTAVATPTSVKPTGTTTYVLVAQNAAGCKDTANVVVTVNAKPSAGKDTMLVCSNGNVPSSVQLSATPTGGTWSALTGNPTGATVNSSGLVSITNATAQGKSFDFVYSVNGCQDTVKVIVPVCQQPCIKSSISSAAPVCSNDAQTYSFTFTVANKLGTIKVNKGTLSGNNPYTVSGIPSGQNVIITDSLSAICKSDTIIAGVNCNCNPALPKLITSSFTVCIGDTFPTLKATVVGLATVEWFSQQTGGTVLSTGLNYKPSGTVTANTVFYAQARSTDPTCPTAVSTSRVPATINAQSCIDTIDLALKKSINTKIARVGDVLTYTIKVWNEWTKNATGVEVTDSIATTVQFVSGSFVASRGSASISGNVIKWTIGNIAANGDTVTLRYQVKATQAGIHLNTAEISKTNEKDKDSTPGNGKGGEDDIDQQCFTVPFELCEGQKLEVGVPANLTNVQWFKNGGTTAVATGNVVLFSEVGVYTFTATNQTCPANGCCPVIIEAGANCCPVEVCIPYTVKKVKK